MKSVNGWKKKIEDHKMRLNECIDEIKKILTPKQASIFLFNLEKVILIYYFLLNCFSQRKKH